MKKRKLLSPEQKATILADAKVLGVSAAAKTHGVSANNIYNWAAKNGKAKAKTKPRTGKQPAPVTSPLAVVLGLVKNGQLAVGPAEMIIKGLGR